MRARTANSDSLGSTNGCGCNSPGHAKQHKAIIDTCTAGFAYHARKPRRGGIGFWSRSARDMAGALVGETLSGRKTPRRGEGEGDGE